MPPFRFPYYLNPNYNRNYYYKSTSNPAQDSISDSNSQNKKNITNVSHESKKNNSKSNYENYFFELFGLKLYFDDVLLISLLFFLYEEGVKDNELFFSLVLLLLS